MKAKSSCTSISCQVTRPAFKISQHLVTFVQRGFQFALMSRIER